MESSRQVIGAAVARAGHRTQEQKNSKDGELEFMGRHRQHGIDGHRKDLSAAPSQHLLRREMESMAAERTVPPPPFASAVVRPDGAEAATLRRAQPRPTRGDSSC
jgi:hypothetical protein